MECPACSEISVEFIHYFWDQNGKEREKWLCSSCGLEISC